MGGSGSLGGASPVEPGQGPQGNLPKWSNSTSRVVSWVTGPKSPNDTLTRFTISGTDLGIAWDNGSGQTLLAFGDTFGWCNVTGHQWRNNVLARHNDTNLADGLSIGPAVVGDTTSGAVVDPTNFATELIGGQRISGIEMTVIPTAGISVNGKQYLNVMSVREWGPPGVWTTNYSAIAVSGDNGQTWALDQSTMRVNAPVTFALPADAPTVNVNNRFFQQSGYVRGHGADSGFVYQVGTPNGRFGNAYLARVPAAEILDLTKYEYWLGNRWTADLGALNETSSAIVKGNISELSVAWSAYLGKYVMLDADGGVRIRTAPSMSGPWSSPRMLVPAVGGPALYGPMILPSSPALTSATDNRLYFNGSQWSDYNVMLVESKLRSGW